MSCANGCSTRSGRPQRREDLPGWLTRDRNDPRRNCASEVVQIFGIFDVLAAANGINVNTAAVSLGEGGAAKVSGDHLLLKPYGNERHRLLRIASPKSGVNWDDVSFGRPWRNDHNYGFSIEGSFEKALQPLLVSDCDAGLQECGWELLNPGCLPSFGNNDPLKIPFNNSNAADATDVVIGVEMVMVADGQGKDLGYDNGPNKG